MDYKLHLYFPNIILDNKYGQTIRLKLIDYLKADNIYDLTDAQLNDIIDKCVFSQNSIKLLFQQKKGETRYYQLFKIFRMIS